MHLDSTPVRLNVDLYKFVFDWKMQKKHCVLVEVISIGTFLAWLAAASCLIWTQQSVSLLLMNLLVQDLLVQLVA